MAKPKPTVRGILRKQPKTPYQMRLDGVRNAKGAINWVWLDPWLRVLKRAGSLTALAKDSGIGIETLRWRRRELGLAPLPRGRRHARAPTAKEMAVHVALESTSQRQLAFALNVSPQAVNQLAAKATKRSMVSECVKCDGYGVLPCSECTRVDGTRIPAHFHVCDLCGGINSLAEPIKMETR